MSDYLDNQSLMQQNLASKLSLLSEMQLFYASRISKIVVFSPSWWLTDWSEVINLTLHHSVWLYMFFQICSRTPQHPEHTFRRSLNLFLLKIKAEKAEGNHLSSKCSCIDADFCCCSLQFHILSYFVMLTQCLPLSCLCPLSSLSLSSLSSPCPNRLYWQRMPPDSGTQYDRKGLN